MQRHRQRGTQEVRENARHLAMDNNKNQDSMFNSNECPLLETQGT